LTDLCFIEKKAEKLVIKPVIEEVSQKEVYLLENNKRVRRICGKIDNKLPCLKDAGQGTIHVGEGWCNKHETSISKRHLDKYIKNLSKEADLQKYLKIVDKTQDDYYSTESLLKLLHSFLLIHLSKAQFEWSKKEADHAVQLIDQMRKLIDTENKKQQNKILALGIATWIRGVLDVVFKNVSIDTYSKIKDQILSIDLPQEVQDIEFEEIK